MPFRNLIILSSIGFFSLVCYSKAIRSHYGSLLAAAIGEVTQEYVEPVDKRELLEGALDGMLRQLDPYSEYISPDDLVKFEEEIDQEFGGVGIVVEVNPQTRRLTVLSPLPDTPAYHAGLRAGDMILSIDGQSTDGFIVTDAVDLMRGKPGTSVQLTILHAGQEEPFDLALERAIIPIASVLGDQRRPDGSWDFALREQPKLAFVRLVTFGDQTASELRQTLSSLAESNQFDGLILDLRGNAGGLLTAAVAVADMFIDEGAIVSIRGRRENDRRDFEATRPTTIWRDVPMVVLVNRWSASASEIVAACLQDHQRATIVGERTWGKGTVQNVLSFEGGKSALKLTTATYWRPSGRNIHRGREAQEKDEWGVRPDPTEEVRLTDAEFEKVMLLRRDRDYGPAPADPADSAPADSASNVSPGTAAPAGAESGPLPDEADFPARQRQETGDPQPDSARENSPSVDAEVDLEGFVDPQLKRAIEVLNRQLAARTSAQAA